MILHASLLPHYRGAAPINWAIINGEERTGTSTFFLKHEIDTGEILLQNEIGIAEDETAGSLHDKLMISGAELLLQSVNLIEKGNYSTQSQLEMVPEGLSLQELPIAPKIFREDCHIDWGQTAQQVDCFIRGLSPYPSAWTSIQRKSDGKLFNLKIYGASLSGEKSTKEVGSIFSKGSQLFVNCSNRLIELTDLQLEGKKRMNSLDFTNGINLNDYEEELI